MKTPSYIYPLHGCTPSKAALQAVKELREQHGSSDIVITRLIHGQFVVTHKKTGQTIYTTNIMENLHIYQVLELQQVTSYNFSSFTQYFFYSEKEAIQKAKDISTEKGGWPLYVLVIKIDTSTMESTDVIEFEC